MCFASKNRWCHTCRGARLKNRWCSFFSEAFCREMRFSVRCTIKKSCEKLQSATLRKMYHPEKRTSLKNTIKLINKQYITPINFFKAHLCKKNSTTY